MSLNVPQGWPDLSNTVVCLLGFSFFSKMLRIKNKHRSVIVGLYISRGHWHQYEYLFPFFRGTGKPIVGCKGTWQKSKIPLMFVWLTRPPQCSSKQSWAGLPIFTLVSTWKKDKWRNRGITEANLLPKLIDCRCSPVMDGDASHSSRSSYVVTSLASLILRSIAEPLFALPQFLRILWRH